MPKVTIPKNEKNTIDEQKIPQTEENVALTNQATEIDIDENTDEEIEEEAGSIINVEDLDPELEIWTNGPKAKDIVEWKKKYGDVYVTSVTFDKHVVWKTLNRQEYKMIVRQIEQVVSSGKMTQTEANMLNEELVCQFCTLYPQFSNEDFSREMAGLPSILAQQILESSGFTTVDVRQL